MDKLLELQERKNELYAQICEMRDEFNGEDRGAKEEWESDERRTAWEALNADFDKVDAELEKAKEGRDVASRVQE